MNEYFHSILRTAPKVIYEENKYVIFKQNNVFGYHFQAITNALKTFLIRRWYAKVLYEKLPKTQQYFNERIFENTKKYEFPMYGP